MVPGQLPCFIDSSQLLPLTFKYWPPNTGLLFNQVSVIGCPMENEKIKL